MFIEDGFKTGLETSKFSAQTQVIISIPLPLKKAVYLNQNEFKQLKYCLKRNVLRVGLKLKNL